MAEQLPGDEVGGRVTVEFRTTGDIYAANFRTINRMIADEFAGLLDGQAAVDAPAVDPRRQLIRREATEAEQSLPRSRELCEDVGGQLPVGEIDRAQAVRRVIAEWAPLLDPGDPAVAAYLARLVEKFPEIEAALADGGIDLGLDDVEP
jgi:hypothetical protein